MKKGFTLAEVLITLGIIGVVCALTIPIFIEKHQKTVTATRLKEAYSIFSQAIDSAISHEGDLTTWNTSLSNDEFIQQYIAPYLQVKKCNKYNVSSLPTRPDSYAYAGWATQTYCIDNGMSFTYTNSFPTRVGDVVINVDINGKSKPNRAGIDVFTFEANKSKNRLIAFNQGQNRDFLTTPGFPRIPCSTTSVNWYAWAYGASCAALIILDGWQIKEDYPW